MGSRKKASPDQAGNLKPKRIPASERRAIFVREYLIDRNATRAAKAAGFSEKTAQEQGSRLLSNVMVQQMIADLTAKHLDKLDVTGERVIEAIAKIAFAPTAEKTRDRLKALELLGRWRQLALWKDNLGLGDDKPPSDDLNRLLGEMRTVFGSLRKERK